MHLTHVCVSPVIGPPIAVNLAPVGLFLLVATTVSAARFQALVFATLTGKETLNVAHVPLVGPELIALLRLRIFRMCSCQYGLYLEKGISRPYLERASISLELVFLLCLSHQMLLSRSCQIKFLVSTLRGLVPRRSLLVFLVA